MSTMTRRRSTAPAETTPEPEQAPTGHVGSDGAPERFGQAAAQLRAQGQTARTETAAAVAKARAELMAAERAHGAVEQALGHLEPIAADLEARGRAAALIPTFAGRVAELTAHVTALEEQRDTHAARSAELTEKLGDLRTQHAEVRSALGPARSSGDVDRFEQLRAREAALDEVIADLSQQQRQAAAEVHAIENPESGVAKIRADLAKAEQSMNEYQNATQCTGSAEVRAATIALARSLRPETAPEAARQRIVDALAAVPEYAKRLADAEATLQARVDAGEPLDQESPTVRLSHGPEPVGGRLRHVPDTGRPEVHAPAGRDRTMHVWRRTGMLEQHGNLVLHRFDYAGPREY